MDYVEPHIAPFRSKPLDPPGEARRKRPGRAGHDVLDIINSLYVPPVVSLRINPIIGARVRTFHCAISWSNAGMRILSTRKEQKKIIQGKLYIHSCVVVKAVLGRVVVNATGCQYCIQGRVSNWNYIPGRYSVALNLYMRYILLSITLLLGCCTIQWCTR